jgi:hypothetical protein
MRITAAVAALCMGTLLRAVHATTPESLTQVSGVVAWTALSKVPMHRAATAAVIRMVEKCVGTIIAANAPEILRLTDVVESQSEYPYISLPCVIVTKSYIVALSIRK